MSLAMSALTGGSKALTLTSIPWPRKGHKPPTIRVGRDRTPPLAKIIRWSDTANNLDYQQLNILLGDPNSRHRFQMLKEKIHTTTRPHRLGNLTCILNATNCAKSAIDKHDVSKDR